ncbi:hypothetical protein [Entomospira culicis]|uniref:Uncharacterized protein n=1 Tax=Entomospira culicis TaxID=2719989 RepID=A0A968GHD3_9SPIO|nr:hypothetical protein [Entomospira culicis]NIZ19920.1 hypothetical protein [Entomospira culicis]NIZ70123.1 hypothetical protein [Entomospira culicis]WDI38050.1 hypothetical protein PVA46_07880 [Entomospira culicis]WDI39673.1 hypothetical protein PVA47_07880 [Entomospira culicis]
MKYFFMSILFIAYTTNAFSLSRTQAIEDVTLLLESSYALKHDSKKREYQALAQWEKNLTKELGYVKKMQGKGIQSDKASYDQLLSQAYGHKEVVAWQTKGIYVSMDSPMGIVVLLVAIKLIYPENRQLATESLNRVYKHQAVASNLYQEQNRLIQEMEKTIEPLKKDKIA